MNSAVTPSPASSGQAVATVAVTGSGGFLGSHVCRELLERGCRVRAVTHTGGDDRSQESVGTRIEE